MTKHRIYPSKILLAGEYTVLTGHPGLAIPNIERFANWHNKQMIEDPVLSSFYKFLLNAPLCNTLIQLDEFKHYISHGGYLETNIPFGYGLGSSGALCAAVLDRFSTIDKSNTKNVHQILKEMEHFFHGQSSGLDPMISYYNRCILLDHNELYVLNLIQQNILSEYSLHLIDSKVIRNTQYLVSLFKQNCQQPEYKLKIETDLVPANKKLIEAFKENAVHDFQNHWIQISIKSIQIFKLMIPDNILKFWEAGLQNGAYYCKLCGAGGGGLFLTMVKNEEVFKEALSLHSLNEFI